MCLKTKNLLFLIITVLFSIACKPSKTNALAEFSTGKVYPKVQSMADTGITYALCLPESYSSGKPHAILVFFDSHGNGLLPVNLFKEDALKNGFILAGSNNSKNGMTSDQTNAIYRSLIADLSTRFNLEKKAVYLCGFSGGSRVASGAAISEGGVAGVIGCGAGWPNVNEQPKNPFSYLGVAGEKDFNLTEMKRLDVSLDQAGFIHHLLTFDGIHQWPLKEIIPEIITWIRFDAMRQGAFPVDRNLVNVFIEKNDSYAENLASRKNLPEQQQVYIKMLHYLQGLTDVAPLQKEIERLAGMKEVKEYNEKQKQLLDLENKLQAEYSPEIENNTVSWWTKKAGELHEQADKTSDKSLAAVYNRLLGYLSLNCYMRSTGALKHGDLVGAEKYVEIYRLVDPENAEHRYLAAKIAALKNRNDEAFECLNQAIALGFKDFNSLKSDPDFKLLQQDNRFTKLLK